MLLIFPKLRLGSAVHLDNVISASNSNSKVMYQVIQSLQYLKYHLLFDCLLKNIPKFYEIMCCTMLINVTNLTFMFYFFITFYGITARPRYYNEKKNIYDFSIILAITVMDMKTDTGNLLQEGKKKKKTLAIQHSIYEKLSLSFCHMYKLLSQYKISFLLLEIMLNFCTRQCILKSSQKLHPF